MASRFSVEAVFKAVDRMTAPVSRMQNRVGKMTRAMSRGIRRANKAVGRLTTSLMTGLKRGAIGAAAVVTGLGLAIKGVADQADALAKRSRRLDFPIEDLQQWQFVAEQSGFTMAEFDKSIEGMAKRMGEARAGTGSLYTFLVKTNTALLTQLQNTDNVSDAMDILIGAMQNARNPMERAALANAAFGRQGLKMANIAELGADRIQALRMEQERNGVITREQAEAAEAYNDAINSLKRALFGFLQSVLLPMLPMMTDLIRQFREWTIANKEIIAGRILEFVENLVANFSNIVTWVKRIGTYIGIFLALGAVLKTIAAVMLVVNLAMMANPIGLIVVGVIAAVSAFMALWHWIDKVVAIFENAPGWLKPFLTPIYAVIKAIQLLKTFAGWLSSRFSGDEPVEEQGLGGNQGAGRNVVSPQDRTARSIEERRTSSSAEVTIKDQTGRAEITKGKLGPGLALQPSGDF